MQEIIIELDGMFQKQETKEVQSQARRSSFQGTRLNHSPSSREVSEIMTYDTPHKQQSIKRINFQLADPMQDVLNLSSQKSSDFEMSLEEILEKEKDSNGEESEMKNPWGHLPEDFKPFWILVVLALQFTASLNVNIDMGILPAASIQIKEELMIENAKFGFLGSVVYLGQTIGSAFAAQVLANFKAKYVLSTFLAFNIITLLVFTVTTDFVVISVSRLLTGVFQVFFAIYLPVWSDCYGNPIQQSQWMTYMLIANPLGVIIGYLFTALTMDKHGWRFSFYIQCMVLFPSLLGILVTPNKYFDIPGASKLIKQQQRRNDEEKSQKRRSLQEEKKLLKILNLNEKEDINETGNLSMPRDSLLTKGEMTINFKKGSLKDKDSSSIKIIRDKSSSDEKVGSTLSQSPGSQPSTDGARRKEFDEYGNSSLIPPPSDSQQKIREFQKEYNKTPGQMFRSEIQEDRYQGPNIISFSKTQIHLTTEEHSFVESLKLILSNKIYLMVCMSLTGLYWVIAAIQYWVSEYLITVIMVDENTVFATFAFISITGPVLGVVVGGNITSKLGGYSSYRALYTSLIEAIICMFVAIPIPFLNDFVTIAVLLWFLLFFGGAILPCMTGIMLRTVEYNLRTQANSIANLSYNLFGFLPSPFFYGVIADYGDGNNHRAAMKVLMFIPTATVILFSFATYMISKNNILRPPIGPKQ